MKREDWLLLVLTSAEGDSLSPVQLQKSLFLLGQLMPKKVGKNYYNFKPYHYGPFDPAIYSDAESPAMSDLVTIERIPGRGWASYSATPAGLQKGKKLEKQVREKNVLNNLKTVVTWTRKLSFQELVRTIYHYFPAFRKNSVFQD